MLQKLGWLVFGIGSMLAGLLGFHPNPPQLLGSAATVPAAVANISTSLASGVSISDTSMTLVNGNDPLGTALTGYMCFTIDANTASSEFVCGTAAGTSVTSLTRGISPTNPNATSSTLILTHRRGATVIGTNYPILGVLTRLVNGQDTFPNVLSYTTSPSFSSNTQLIDKFYADSLAKQGVATSTEESVSSVPGAVVLATNAQAASGVASTTTGAPLVLLSRSATSTPGSNASNVIPVTGTNGKLSQSFIDLSQPFTFSGGITANTATTTLNSTTTIAATSNAPIELNGVSYNFPSTRSASNTVPTEDGSGNIKWQLPYTSITSTSTQISLSSTGGTTASTTVYCTGNKIAAGGGYSGLPAPLGDGSPQYYSGIQNVNDNSPSQNGWHVSITCDITSSAGSACNTGTVTVYAMCINP